jgi:hypothetical protein
MKGSDVRSTLLRCDVAVVGGGGAGLAAAVAAARAGAHTVLLDRHGALGGMATAALVHSVCGLYLLREEPGAVLANPGFPSELAAHLLDSGSPGAVRMGRVDVLPHLPTAFACVADRLAAQTDGLEVRLHSEVAAARCDGQGVELEVACRGARETIRATAVVDASGDAVVAALAGSGFEQECERLQRPAFVFVLQGVARGALDDGQRLAVAHRIAAATRDGALPRGALGASLRASGRPGEAFVTIDLEGVPDRPFDPTDAACLTALEMHGRALASDLTQFLRDAVPGFAAVHIGAFPARVGVRESRRALGELRLEAADLASGATFPDAIGLATWPMELRETATGPRLRFPESGRPCEIPLRALRARRVPRLFIAGRCIAASHAAQASIRVIGTCLATGEAAGLGAAAVAGGATATTLELAREVVAARDRLMVPRAAVALGGHTG